MAKVVIKLAYVANARIPTEKAHGIQIMKMCDELANMTDLELVVPKRMQTGEMKKVVDVYRYYRCENRFKIRRLTTLDITPSVPRLLWLQQILHPLFCLSFGLITSAYLLVKRPDVIYSRDLLTAIFLGFLGQRVFFEAHSYPHTKLGQLIKPRLLGLVSGIVAVNSILAKKYQRDNGNILVAHDGVDLEFKEPKLKFLFGQAQGKKIIVYTGRLTRDKGAHILLEAMTMLPKYHCYIIGGHNERETREYMSLVRRFKVFNITLVGYVRHQLSRSIQLGADVLVLPNSAKYKHSREYTSPMKLFEYMASGRVIVASDIPAIREVLDYSCAILFEPDNSKGLAQGIELAFNNKELSKRLVNNAYEKVKEYTWGKRADKIINFITQL